MNQPSAFADDRAAAEAMLDEQVAQLWALLFGLVLDGEKRLAEHLAAHGLTAPQFYVLKTLSEHEGRLGIGQIARLHGLTNATLTGLVTRLEKLSPPLVARETDSTDRRAVVVRLLPAGHDRYHAVQDGLYRQLRAVFELLPEAERRKLVDNLAHYTSLLRLFLGNR
jgi:DNA-binding MarR family transcriptional regulator